MEYRWATATHIYTEQTSRTETQSFHSNGQAISIVRSAFIWRNPKRGLNQRTDDTRQSPHGSRYNHIIYMYILIVQMLHTLIKCRGFCGEKEVKASRTMTVTSTDNAADRTRLRAEQQDRKREHWVRRRNLPPTLLGPKEYVILFLLISANQRIPKSF